MSGSGGSTGMRSVAAAATLRRRDESKCVADNNFARVTRAKRKFAVRTQEFRRRDRVGQGAFRVGRTTLI